MRHKKSENVKLWEFVWMYGIVAATGLIGTLIFVGMCIGGIA